MDKNSAIVSIVVALLTAGVFLFGIDCQNKLHSNKEKIRIEAIKKGICPCDVSDIQ